MTSWVERSTLGGGSIALLIVLADDDGEPVAGDRLAGCEDRCLLKRAMGSMAFSAQYLQSPVPLGGNLIRWDWFRRWTELPEKERFTQEIVQSWDTASKAAELNDYSVGITAMVLKEAIYILSVVRERLEFPALKRRIATEKDRWKATMVLIEDKGSGTNLIQDRRNDGVFSIAIEPEGDKIVRMSAGSACIEDGRVFLPQKAPWLDDFRSEVLAYPTALTTIRSMPSHN
ncbi:phage terminase large subunit [Mesorhizobium kowhaii]|uniref:Terminase large subunit gp17-like C-terminal domain-containing protein n=1 Tax=Mesorhizobium kowhaii TaxID=1300272 RepID=A0A2W7C495_9HYPH|nr:phage terminase large subunit [Mesorhizobium kowhaii]PZV37171.1 hypothetical protein B5V02_17635 [Mesorhizobium kowhaii]